MSKAPTNQLPKFSGSIESFLAVMEQAQRDFTWNEEQVTYYDGLQQDYLHQLELDGLDYKGRARLATQLMKCRQHRRESKDTVRALSPLVEFLDSDKGRQLTNLMKEVLGRTRKVEKQMENRVYVPRVLYEEAKPE